MKLKPEYLSTHMEGVTRDGDWQTLCGQAWALWTTLEPSKVDCKTCLRVLSSKAHAKRNPAKEGA